MNFGVVSALIQNDLKDLRRNLTFLPIIFLPPLLALIMQKMSGSPPPLAQSLPMWMVYGQILVGMNLVSLGLAEEKEKKTLEALLVSPAGLLDIVGAKIGFGLMITLFVQALTIGVVDGFVGNLAVMALISIIGTLFFLAVGLAVGFLSPNQKSAGALSTPIMLIFLLGPMIGSVSQVLRKITAYLPSLNILELYRVSITNQNIFQHHTRDVVSLLIWTAALMIANVWILRRQQR